MSLLLRLMFAVVSVLKLLSLPPIGCEGQEYYYKLSVMMNGSTFLDNFNFFTDNDPTHGYVNYVDSSTAIAKNYTSLQDNGNLYIGVDHSTVVASGSRGRDSIRLESKLKYTTGLFIFDLDHMPYGCGVWPAFWTCGDNWPYNGEIDIIEQVHTATVNEQTLHTDGGCSMAHEDISLFSGSFSNTNCNVFETQNSGCGIEGLADSFGSAFDKNNGGVYAMEWTDSIIQVFFFNRTQANQMPDVWSSSPDPTSWGKPVALWQLGSNCPSNHFYQHKIIINTAFCGDWAGNTFSQACSSVSNGATCNDYVKYNPASFIDAYWSIKSLRVYQQQQATEEKKVF
jgi:beta-glucanase (GH16 family)